MDSCRAGLGIRLTLRLVRALPTVFRRVDLADIGLTPHDLSWLLGSGTVVQPVRGVYVLASEKDDFAVRAAAVALALPDGAAVARTAAAWLHGVDCRPPGGLDVPLPLDVLVATGREPPAHASAVGHVDRLPPSDVADLGGIPVTTPARTVLDLARFLPPFMGLAAADALARSFALDPQELSERLREWRGQRYVRRARRVLELCEPRAESFGESWTRLRLVEAGFPPPEPQIWIQGPDGTCLYRLDMGYREVKAAIEYDGEEFHSDPASIQHDERRRARLADDYGWRVLTVRKGDVLGRALTLELAVGELLGLEPRIQRRAW